MSMRETEIDFFALQLANSCKRNKRKRAKMRELVRDVMKSPVEKLFLDRICQAAVRV